MINGTAAETSSSGDNHTNGHSHEKPGLFQQEQIAIVGFACRLPDSCSTPQALWEFMEHGKVASINPPISRFNAKAHHDSPHRPQTTVSPGGMFLQDVDPRDIDAQFFRLTPLEATAMDPQQRQLLEVVYEGLENSGVTLEGISGEKVGCFVGSFACDYGDMQCRDPEDRVEMMAAGVGRAMLSNRISHFLNIKGPSMTIDTACSGTLYGVDIACKYLHTGEINGAIVAGANLFLNPDHQIDRRYALGDVPLTRTGACFTFDSRADGYIKAEGVNMVYLKRLDDAIKDGDPIRAVIRGSSMTSDGWTAGIMSPDSKAQAETILQAYKNAGISNLSETSYIECHGTGTKAGDVIEVNGVASVFSHGERKTPLRIGSVKSNIGHSEPAAGISGLLKTILSIERGFIPGNPTFQTPNPKIDFVKLGLQPSRVTTPWPNVPLRRASVNSFGYGGSNAHVIVEEAKISGHNISSYITELDDPFADVEILTRPYLLVLSANDELSLDSHLTLLDRHISNPNVRVSQRDLAYTLSERRTRHYYRGFIIASGNRLDVHGLVTGNAMPDIPKLGYVFTGQGSHWVAMGKDLIQNFPIARERVSCLDNILKYTHDPPTWSLHDALISPWDPETLKSPEISQPLVTAIQLALIAVLESCGVSPDFVIGHSSGEVAAAVAAGKLNISQAIKIAYYRGKVASAIEYQEPVGMLAVGLDVEKVKPYLEGTSVEIACYNSPVSLTLSGTNEELFRVEAAIKKDGYFARKLQVNAAYHSKHMAPIAEEYQMILERYVDWSGASEGYTSMFSSTTGKLATYLGPSYWVKNMLFPVLFTQAVQLTVSQQVGIDLLVEIGPSNTLEGPIKQISKSLSSPITYISAWKRGPNALESILQLSGKLFTMGYPIELAPINADDIPDKPIVITDLPNYSWNHSTKYWYESNASKDWRYRQFKHHELIGGKVLGTLWTQPIWKLYLHLDDIPWLRDHQIWEKVIVPGATYVAMAIEALFQQARVLGLLPDTVEINQATYQLRNIIFTHPLIIEDDGKDYKITLSLTGSSESKHTWRKFQILSSRDNMTTNHCQGQIRIIEVPSIIGTEVELQPLQHPMPAMAWYEAAHRIGHGFGSMFESLDDIEWSPRSLTARAVMSLKESNSKFGSSRYPMHPAWIDACVQAAGLKLASPEINPAGVACPPAAFDDIIIYAQNSRPQKALSVSHLKYNDIGRLDDPNSYTASSSVYNPETGELLLRISGMQPHSLDSPDNDHIVHKYTQIAWNPDISLMLNSQVAQFVLKPSELKLDGTSKLGFDQVAKIVELNAHKNSSLKFLEVTFIDNISDTWWHYGRGNIPNLAAQCDYHLSLPTDSDLVKAQLEYKDEENSTLYVHNQENPFALFEDDHSFNIILILTTRQHQGLEKIVEDSHQRLHQSGHVIVVFKDEESLQMNGDSTSPDLLSLAKFDRICLGDSNTRQYIEKYQIGYIGSPILDNQSRETGSSTTHLIHFGPQSEVKNRIRDCLSNNGLQILDQSLSSASEIPEKSPVLVLDEIFSHTLADMTNEQLQALQSLIYKDCRILWVTQGAQMDVSNPRSSLFFGLVRCLRSEHPTNAFISLDIASHSEPGSLSAIQIILEKLSKENFEDVNGDDEFVERDGVLHISRVIPDDAMNQLAKDKAEGPQLELGQFHGHPLQVQLTSNRLGTFNGLRYAINSEDLSLGDDDIQVEVHASALNYKDVAISLGMVPGNERKYGLECVGVVTNVGKAVTSFSVGDKVATVMKDGGGFSNKLITPSHLSQKIPEGISFEEATTIPICFATALYALKDLASVQAGQSVLIHSATGGIGLAAIQICRHLKAEIFVTAGTEEKRLFLKNEYDIAPDRIFSSRSITLSIDLLNNTNNRGVDVVLNSLTGDLFQESWRCVAPGGTFIEMGKKDILDKGMLPLEQFERNVTFRAFDLLDSSFKENEIARLLGVAFKMLVDGHIKPLRIDKIFSFTDIVDSFRYMNGRTHIGKIVVSNHDRVETKALIQPVLPAMKLKHDVSYLIVGGLKGLCGSLAMNLVRNGAKNLVIISRSGYEDERSRLIVFFLKEMGAHLDLVQGDVANIEDVRRAFRSSSFPIGGIIQGAMVLKDKAFMSMGIEDFHGPLKCKVQGSWNLHTCAMEEKSPLEFFTLLSSISCLLGQHGQGSYSAGNMFLDSLAAYRQSLGLPACSVNLGVIEGIGYFNRDTTLLRRVKSRGLGSLDEAMLHKILAFSIIQQTNTSIKKHILQKSQLITGIPVPMEFDPSSKMNPRFSTLVPNSKSGRGGDLNSSKDAENDIDLALLKRAHSGHSKDDDSNLLPAAIKVVNKVLMKSLGMDTPLDEARPLTSYGIDSLASVELRNWVRTELSIELGALDVAGAKTLVALCQAILKNLRA